MGESVLIKLCSVVAESALESSSSSASTWLIPGLFTLMCGIILWFVRDKFSSMEKHAVEMFRNLKETDKRIEGSLEQGIGELKVGLTDLTQQVTTVNRCITAMDRRLLRIEGGLGKSPIIYESPIKLTEVGLEILANSGIKSAADNNSGKLLDAIKSRNPETAYDVQEVTRKLFQSFAFSDETIKEFKEYSYQSGQWGLYDILDIGAIYFRDVALKELGYTIEEVDKSDPVKQ